MITNPSLDLQISKWQIQYDGLLDENFRKNLKNCGIFLKICIPWFFGSLIVNLTLDLQNSK